MGGRGGSRGKATRAGTTTVDGVQKPLYMVVTKTEKFKGKDTYLIEAHRGGTTAGEMRIVHDQKNGSVQIYWVKSNIKGVGRRLYAQAMLKAKSLGAKTFSSDKTVSKSAVKAWDGLKKNGLPVTTHRHKTLGQDAFTGGDDAGSKRAYGKSVYSVNLEGVSQRRLRKILGGN